MTFEELYHKARVCLISPDEETRYLAIKYLKRHIRLGLMEKVQPEIH